MDVQNWNLDPFACAAGILETELSVQPPPHAFLKKIQRKYRAEVLDTWILEEKINEKQGWPWKETQLYGDTSFGENLLKFYNLWLCILMQEIFIEVELTVCCLSLIDGDIDIGESLSKNIPSSSSRWSIDNEAILRFYCSIFFFCLLQ